MYNILIVDDERPVVSWLYELLNRSLSFEAEIHTAYSAIDAMGIVDTHLLDIVISDIRMPRMSGLELMRYIKEKQTSTHIIFLTGFNEFDSVYEAIGHDNVQYLLKTEEDDALLAAIDKAHAAIEAKQKAILLANRKEELLRLLNNRDYLMRFLDNAISYDDFIGKNCQLSLKVDFRKEMYLALCHIPIVPENRHDVFAGLYLLAAEIMGGAFLIDQADYSESFILWFIQPLIKTGSNEAISRLDRIIADAAAHLQLEMAIVISNGLAQPNTLPRVLPLAIGKQSLLANMGSGVAVPYDVDTKADKDQISGSLSGQFLLFRQMLELNRRDDCLSLLDKLLAPLKQAKSLNDVSLIELYLSVATHILSYSNACNITQALSFRIGMGRLSRLHDFSGWNEAKAYLKDVCIAIFDEMKDKPMEKKGTVVNQLKQHINANLGGDLSLTSLSRELHYNASYLSRLFKAEAGQNLFDYITECRLIKAAEELKKSPESIYLVAKSFGFDNPSYFTKVFKQTYGLTPQEYRER
ncbi:MAG: response regulator [Lachnospiraceae bacterium]|nr:response regulator [Lachnospiraceae bacterium]